MDEEIRSSYEDLVDAWWKIGQALEVEADSSGWKNIWHNRVFCEVLTQCGWTVPEWNSEVNSRRTTSYEEELVPEEPER